MSGRSAAGLLLKLGGVKSSYTAVQASGKAQACHTAVKIERAAVMSWIIREKPPWADAVSCGDEWFEQRLREAGQSGLAERRTVDWH
jgi:hypothetical protein